MQPTPYRNSKDPIPHEAVAAEAKTGNAGKVAMTEEEIAAQATHEPKASSSKQKIPLDEIKNSNIINQSSTAILKNGYYEVNGFKFTEHYYNRLWNKGRKAPSLIAKAILDNAKKIIPDPKGHAGYFKYFSDEWEMIYNPTSKIVSHIKHLK